MNEVDKRIGWTRVDGVYALNGKEGKVYRNLVRFARPCATCGETFIIHVTQANANSGKNNSFQLRNCEKHRMKLTPLQIAAGNGIRPAPIQSTFVEPVQPITAPEWNPNELEKLRFWKSAVTAELAEFDQMRKENHEMRKEIAALKATIADYESGVEIYSDEPYDEIYPDEPQPAKKPFDPHEALRQELALKNNLKKLPWEG